MTANPETAHAHYHQWIASWTCLQQLQHVKLIVEPFWESVHLLLRTEDLNVRPTIANLETACAHQP